MYAGALYWMCIWDVCRIVNRGEGGGGVEEIFLRFDIGLSFRDIPNQFESDASGGDESLPYVVSG